MRFYGLAEVLIIGLIAYRLARVVAHDKIGQPIRDRTYSLIAVQPKLGKWLNALATCPFCLSVYFAAGGVVWFGLWIAPEWPGWAEVLFAWPAAAGAGALACAVDLALTTYVDKHPA
jgi:hypothetical protein